MTILEIQLGVARKEGSDQSQGALLREWLDGKVLPAFEGRILPVDVDVARSAALLHLPSTRSERDALIAATAIVHGLSMVTRNVRDFQDLPVAVTNLWEAVSA